MVEPFGDKVWGLRQLSEGAQWDPLTVELPSERPKPEAAMGWIIGAYAASPSTVAWDPAAESRFLAAISALPGFRGLELPFNGALHAHDEAWLLRSLQSDWDIVITLLPGTIARMKDDPMFGLASTDDAGRRKALSFTAQAREAVARLNDREGRRAVLAVEVHSAPRADAGASSVDAFTASLAELASWDWEGARLVVEHCDALVSQHPPVKGFQTLSDEIRAVQNVDADAGAPIGMVINWGRSAIEERLPDAAIRHVREVRDVGLLCGVFLSGCSATQSRLGPAWADVHLPAAAEGSRDPALEPASLLTRQRVADVLHEAGEVSDAGFRGLKVAAPRTADVDLRIATVARSLTVVRAADEDARQSSPPAR